MSGEADLLDEGSGCQLQVIRVLTGGVQFSYQFQSKPIIARQNCPGGNPHQVSCLWFNPIHKFDPQGLVSPGPGLLGGMTRLEPRQLPEELFQLMHKMISNVELLSDKKQDLLESLFATKTYFHIS